MGGGWQDILRWSGQNANQKVGPDKMPITEKSHGQNANLGWHFVRLAFCPVGILSYHLHHGHHSYQGHQDQQDGGKGHLAGALGVGGGLMGSQLKLGDR